MTTAALRIARQALFNSLTKDKLFFVKAINKPALANHISTFTIFDC